MPEMENLPSARENPVLFGHGETEAALRHSCATGRMPHAVLIGGPKGIGKATLAFRLARHLLKGDTAATELIPSDNFDMSPDEPVFRQVAAGGHPSMRVIERSRNQETGRLRRDIVVDDIRALSDFYRLTSRDGNWRVAIIDAAEDMNPNAANALLKILEEPPERSVIILVSHAPGRLLPTIRSRCRTVQMTALSHSEMNDTLRHFGVDPGGGEAGLLLDIADGSPGMALQVLRVGGIDLFREVQSFLTAREGTLNRDLNNFAERLSRNGQDEAYELFTHLFERAITRITIEKARANMAELDRWVEVWEKVRVLFAQGNALALDRKHVILNAFLYLSEAAGTRAAS